MTREEIIDGLEIYTVGRLNKDRVDITVEELQKFIDAIKALEKEPILDKIRAEIEQIELLARYTRGDIKQMALDIIDKYKAESEVKE